ncbi:MAG: Smr/MutS family protein [Firmicutes bacterium]|jgi:hypothetical protein|nr:Smr/MutS family protein [Bacillota bacterium]
MEELDLHGLRMAEALEAFVAHHNSLAASGGGTGFKVIHGYGSSGSGGEIRAGIRSLLHSNPGCADYVPGEDMDGNPGYTVVYPRRRLPTGSQRLWDAMVEFCATPKTQADVVHRFVRRNAEPEIVQGLRELERRGRLRSFVKNGKKHLVDARIRPRV